MSEQEKKASDPVAVERLKEMAAAFQASGIHTFEDLRLSISKDLNTGITVVSSRTKTSQALLVALLITEAKDNAGRKGKRRLLHYWFALKTFRAVFALSKAEIRELLKTKGWRGTRAPIGVILRRSFARPERLLSNWKRRWLDASVILVLVALVLLVVRANFINKNNLQYVTTTSAVPAFQMISNQVENKSLPGLKGAFTNLADVRARYSLAAIPAGATLQSNQLLSKELSAKMHDRNIISVPIKTGNYSQTLSPPVEAIMVLTPREPDLKAPSSAWFEVIVLRIEGSGETRSVIVALSEVHFMRASALLGSHDVFLSQPAN